MSNVEEKINTGRMIESEELKGICVDILRYFASYCDKNNLNYYLTAGTLLGAVRHKGFIPWDDDIDIMMPREDYEKMISLYNNSEEKYKLICHEKNNNYFYPFAKLCNSDTIVIEANFNCGSELGIYIDIFPVDGDGNTEKKAKKHLKKCIKTQRKLNHTIATHFFRSNNIVIKEILRYIRYHVLRIIGKEYYYNKLDKLLKKYKFSQSDYVANNCWCTYGVKELLKKEVYEGTIELPFESHKFRALADYDIFLHALYGDYMKLPPIEQRISHHDMEAYWKV